MSTPTSPDATSQPVNDGVPRNQRLVVKLAGLTLAMFAFGYALVPLFDIFCEIAGIGGKTEQISENKAAQFALDSDRQIVIEFTGNTALGLPWQFATNQRTLRVHPGEVSVATYRAENTSGRSMTGLAKFSVTPARASKYLSKTECFCFSNQLLEAGEIKDMPLRFVIDPALPDDVHTITLSYTFFNADKFSENQTDVESTLATHTATAAQVELAQQTSIGEPRS